MGYTVKDRKLVIKPEEAEIVRDIYQRYLELGCVRKLKEYLKDQGIRSARGKILSRGTLYNLLSNPLYTGHIAHKGQRHPGLHEAIIDQALWDKVEYQLSTNRVGLKTKSRKTEKSLLTDKLFDVSGERLVTLYANKRGRRYRYYVSRSLATGTKDTALSGWRLPAAELEHTIAVATLTLLQDREAVTRALTESHGNDHSVSHPFPPDSGTEDSTVIDRFVERVELRPDGICLTLSIASLTPHPNKPLTLTRDIPIKMKRRGAERRMVIGETRPSRVDPVLIKTIARARCWYEDFISGRVTSLTEIASRHGIHKSDVTRVISLAFLAPDIVEDIVAGQQPADLTAQKLLRQVKLPLDWEEQRRVLGYR